MTLCSTRYLVMANDNGNRHEFLRLRVLRIIVMTIKLNGLNTFFIIKFKINKKNKSK